MYKLIAGLMLIVALAKGQVQNVTALSNNNRYYSEVRTDDYIKVNRVQYENTLQDYETQMDKFTGNYEGSVKGIKINLDMLTDGLVQNEKRLNALEVLSDFSKKCVTKYRSSIPTVAYTKTSMANCVNTANNQVNSLLSGPRNTKYSLQNYYTHNFEKELTNCGKTFDNSTVNYTNCVTSVTSTTNSYTISNQKTFATQMDASSCSSNGHIKKAIDCSFNINNRTITLIAEANTLINICLGEDDMKPSNPDINCPDVYYLQQSQVDYKSKTMLNPFYGREEGTDCLVLAIQYNTTQT